MPVDELCDAKAGIIEMFNNEFTVEKFAKNYINIISEIAASIRWHIGDFWWAAYSQR